GVAERVELRAERARAAEPPRDPPVERVARHREEDAERRVLERLAEPRVARPDHRGVRRLREREDAEVPVREREERRDDPDLLHRAALAPGSSPAGEGSAAGWRR